MPNGLEAVMQMLGVNQPLGDEEQDALAAAAMGSSEMAAGWPLAGAVSDLLLNGRFTGMSELVAFLRSDEPIPPLVRQLLANALAGDFLHYRLVPVQKRRGRSKTVADAFSATIAEYGIGRMIEDRVKAGTGFEAAIAEACELLGMDVRQGRSRVAKAYRAWRRDIPEAERDSFSSTLDVVIAMTAPPESSEKPI